MSFDTDTNAQKEYNERYNINLALENVSLLFSGRRTQIKRMDYLSRMIVWQQHLLRNLYAVLNSPVNFQAWFCIHQEFQCGANVLRSQPRQSLMLCDDKSTDAAGFELLASDSRTVQ